MLLRQIFMVTYAKPALLIVWPKYVREGRDFASVNEVIHRVFTGPCIIVIVEE